MIGRSIGRGLGAGIPKRFQTVSFDRKPIVDLEPMVIRHVKGYINTLDANIDEGRGLWFYGDVGTGKTSLAMLVAKTASQSGRSVVVYSVPQLLAEMRSSFDQTGRDSFLGLFRRLCSVDVLVLDDLGAERQTPWVLEQLYSIVNERWQNGASIIVTSNLPKADQTTVLRYLREEMHELNKRREREVSARELAPIIDRLEKLTTRLEALEVDPHDDHMQAVRKQFGDRTVSRLIEICDDPIPIMGTDLRLAVAG